MGYDKSVTVEAFLAAGLGVLLFWLFLWTFINPQMCSGLSCGNLLSGLFFLAREFFGIWGVRVLLLALSSMCIWITVKVGQER